MPSISRSLFISAFMLLLALPAVAQDSISPDITSEEIQAHVDFLASDLLLGRDAGAQGSEIAAIYIAEKFEDLGLKRAGLDWQASFELPGGPVPGQSILLINGEEISGISVVRTDSISGIGDFTCRAVLESGDLTGNLVLVKGVEKTKARKKKAEALFEKGAAGICFISDEKMLKRGTAKKDFRRMGSSGPGDLLTKLSKEKKEGKNTTKDSGDVPEGLREMIAEQLGLDLENANIQVQFVSSDDLTGVLGEDVEEGGVDLKAEGFSEKLKKGLQGLVGGEGKIDFQIGTPDFLFGSSRLNAPVLQVNKSTGDLLMSAVDTNASVSIKTPTLKEGTSTNVLAILEGSDPELKKEYIVIGGHYDHVGADDKGNIWNGADDNASGTAAVMEIAEALSLMEQKPKRSFLFAAWGAEEVGLIGSNAFMKNPPVPKEQIAAYINLDMISRNAHNSIGILGNSDEMYGFAEDVAGAMDFKIKKMPPFFLQASDTGAFVRNNIPCLSFFSGMHSDYHKASDDPHKIDAKKAANVTRIALDVALSTANLEKRPSATKAKSGGFGNFHFSEPKISKKSEPIKDNTLEVNNDKYRAIYEIIENAEGKETPEKKRWLLGIYPSLEQGERGIIVDKIVQNSIASFCGLKKGDIILSIGKSDVNNAKDIQKALESLKKNKPFDIEILRKGKKKVKKMALSASFVYEI